MTRLFSSARAALAAAVNLPAWLLLLLCAAVLFLREPGHILHAELWGEDGWVWYPDAYAHGLGSLVMPAAGYFQTLPRLVALAITGLPVLWVPTCFAIAALLIEGATSAYLVGPRMDNAWPDRPSRVLFAFLLLAMPNVSEIFDVVTNAQWHLAVLSFFVLMARVPQPRGGARSIAGWIVDCGILLISGLTGPFVVVLVPVALLRAWQDRRAGYPALIRIVCVALPAIAQVSQVLSVGGRTPVPLGATADLLARIVSQQVVFGALAGQRSMPWPQSLRAWQDGVLPWTGFVIALALVLAAFWRGGTMIRCGLAVAAALFAAAMTHPAADLVRDQWPLMTIPGVGQRYYFFPMLAFVGALVVLAGGRAGTLRGIAIVLLLAIPVGLAVDFRMSPRAISSFNADARAFAAAAQGTTMKLPVLPVGEMVLTKRP